ncbi:hypothetical protein NDA11_006832 [Ustilago hordei]|nr:hypothetical protein NDA11_006832 [Ustilago hordei]
MASDYEVLCAALCKRQDSMTTWTDHRAGNVKVAQVNLANRQVQNEEAYCRGKPRPESDVATTATPRTTYPGIAQRRSKRGCPQQTPPQTRHPHRTGAPSNLLTMSP